MYQAQYKQKLTTADDAAALIPAGATVVHGMASAEPPALLGAIARRVAADDLAGLKVYSLFPMQHAADTLLAKDVAEKLQAYSWFVSSSDRALVDSGSHHFVPNEFHQVPRLIRDFMEVDTAITTVSPMDKAGFFTFGAVNDYISTAARCCKRLLVEVNPDMPRVFGDSLVHISEVTAIVENRALLLEYIPAAAKPEARVIAKTIAEMIPDGACIQMGVGGIPSAVGAYLEQHKDLGIHTELFCPAMVDLIRKGVITGRRKNIHIGKHLFTNALGDRDMYDFINDNPSMESYPVSYTNDPAVIAKNDRMISINSTLEVDLEGQCNSEFLGGLQYSGTGGQLDYVRGAFSSKDGASFIAFYSTAHGGEVSRIVPRFEAGTMVTTPRMDTHYLVTEYGMANLKGRSTRERALDIISLAHPKFRDGLMAEADKMCLL